MHRRRHGRRRPVRSRLNRLALAFLLAAQPALALEKCVGADGKVTYSDKACAAGAKRTTVGPDVSAADVRFEYYDVGTPGGHMGRTDWRLSYKYTRRATPGGGCQVGSLETVLDLKIRMPRWTPPAGAAPDQVSRWQRYSGALLGHEYGHVQNARNTETGFKRAALAAMAADCGSLDASLRSLFDNAIQQGNAADRAYDDQTRHGATQGAVF